MIEAHVPVVKIFEHRLMPTVELLIFLSGKKGLTYNGTNRVC